eukprot:COSAG02_NODE_4602_length_5176_cov_2.578885_4_plen_190_part_00
MGPKGLSASQLVSQWDLELPVATTCRTTRGKPVGQAYKKRQISPAPLVWPSLQGPKLAAQPSGEVIASHRALRAPILPTDGARTHTRAISTGVVAVFRAFSSRVGGCVPGVAAAAASWPNAQTRKSRRIDLLHVHIPIFCSRRRDNSRRLVDWSKTQSRRLAGGRGFESLHCPLASSTSIRIGILQYRY